MYSRIINRNAVSLASRSVCKQTRLSHTAVGSTEAAVRPYNQVPGPAGWPLFGNSFAAAKNLRRLHKFYDSCTKEFGKLFKLKFPGGLNMVVTAEASAVEQVLRAEGKYPVRSQRVSDTYKWLYNSKGFPDGVFFANGRVWKDLRSAMNRQIVPRRMMQYVPAFNETSKHLIDYIEREKDDSNMLHDVCVPFRRWALEGISRVVHDADIQLISHPDEKSQRFISAVQSFADCITEFSVATPLYKIYPTELYKKFNRSFDVMYSIGQEYLDKKYQSIKAAAEAGHDGEEQGVSFLEQWLLEGKMSEREALCQAVDLLAAGTDSTSNTAAFMLHELAKNPRVQQKLYDEVSTVVGTERLATADDLQKLTYVKNCVRETLRLYPTVPYVVRTLENDINVLDYEIPSKTMIIFNLYTAGRSTDYFKNPDDFHPERWQNDVANSFAAIPFGFGSRACYGRRMAELELQLLLTQVSQNFILKTDQKKLPLTEHTFLRSSVPVNLQMIKRM